MAERDLFYRVTPRLEDEFYTELPPMLQWEHMQREIELARAQLAKHRSRFNTVFVAQEGARVHLQFRRDSEARGPDAPFDFAGDLAADGGTLAGTFTGFFHGGRNQFPFRLERRGEPGMERPQPPAPDLHSLAPAGDELAAVFNRDTGTVRLVMLLSPT